MTGMIALVTLEFRVSVSYILIYTWGACVCVCIILLHIFVVCFNFYNMAVCGSSVEIQVKIARGVLARGQNLHGNPMYWVYNNLEGFSFLWGDFLLFCHSPAFAFKKSSV